MALAVGGASCAVRRALHLAARGHVQRGHGASAEVIVAPPDASVGDIDVYPRASVRGRGVRIVKTRAVVDAIQPPRRGRGALLREPKGIFMLLPPHLWDGC